MSLPSPATRRRGRRRLPSLLVAAAALSTLQSCFLFNEFKAGAFALKDDCFELVSADLCIDFETGVLAATGLVASVGPGTNCQPIRKITVTGWVDKDDDGTPDRGEEIESFEHTVAEPSGSDSVLLGSVSLALNATSREAADVHVEVKVERVGSRTPQVYKQKVKKC